MPRKRQTVRAPGIIHHPPEFHGARRIAERRRESGRWFGAIPVVLAVILFVVPFAFGFTSVGPLAWSAWIIAILVALAVASLFGMQNRRATAS